MHIVFPGPNPDRTAKQLAENKTASEGASMRVDNTKSDGRRGFRCFGSIPSIVRLDLQSFEM
jgi:hypothetical protein